MTATKVTAMAPATVSNVACGFDVMGFPLEVAGDEVTATLEGRGVTIARIEGDAGRLPLAADRNTAGVAAAALLRALGASSGVSLIVRKRLPLASGLGGSAASAVAAVVAVDALLNARAPIETLLSCAMEGERVGSGAAHADNVAPGLYGGFVLIRRASPPDIVRLPVPAGLSCAVVHPHCEVETKAARAILGETVPLAAAITQWANVGALVAALHTGDLGLLSRSLEDVIAEPKRAGLVPGFRAMQEAAREAGALGCSLSGSGPSTFALCRSMTDAHRVARAMADALRRHGKLDGDVYVSGISEAGARVIARVE